MFFPWALTLNAQGLLNGILAEQSENTEAMIGPQCGSHFLMAHNEEKNPGFLDAANQSLQKVVQNIHRNSKNTTTTATLTIPVVFHIVYNDQTENLPDSVIWNQLQVLNENFSRQNADTSSLRSVFQPLVGNPNIQFELANQSPDGSPSTGITRTNTNIEHFGGILPYGANQTAQIQQWVTDSLFYNLFRLTKDSLGGASAWNTERYLNIWVGDLRILEPLINNFEELVFLGLAQPPANHPNFAGTGFDTLGLTQGVLMHYVAIGPNNPTNYPTPYNALNNTLKDGDLLSHEVGHTLGLRHIWGDGNCGSDDFIDDTPLSNNSNQFSCNKQRNSCLDSIGGQNLPDMVENFMDYSSDACLNSFTKDQVAVMRSTLFTFRPNLFSIGEEEFSLAKTVSCFPNPTKGEISIVSSASTGVLTLKIFNSSGSLVQETSLHQSKRLEIKLQGPEGLYFIKVSNLQDQVTFKVIKTN